MSKLKRTLTPTQENAIDDAINKLHRLAQASDLLSPASYRASQRDVLRRLLTTGISETVTQGSYIPQPGDMMYTASATLREVKPS